MHDMHTGIIIRVIVTTFAVLRYTQSHVSDAINNYIIVHSAKQALSHVRFSSVLPGLSGKPILSDCWPSINSSAEDNTI